LTVCYRVVGEGEDRDRLERLINNLDLRSVVTLLGALPTPTVLDWMHASQVFMLPSLAEGTPTVLLEAQATGMPVLATDVGGVRDIVPGAAGLLVPGADVGALTDHLIWLADHPERWPDMGQAGRCFVEARHDIDVLNARLAEHFKRILQPQAAS
jgi:colanic acid/amylovoran biosynthesis glycosyltransferase